MKNLLKSILPTLILIVVLSGCHEAKQLRRTKKCAKWDVCQSVTDSVIIKDTVKIDTLVFDDSEVWMDMLFECDSAGDILIRHINNLETENTNLKMQLNDGHLVVYIKEPGDTIQVIKPIHSEKIVNTNTQYINVLTIWQKILIWSGGILLPLFLIWLYLKGKRFFQFIKIQ